MIEVLPIGTAVKLGTDADAFVGLVTEVVISHGHQVRYRVGWWSGRSFNEVLMEGMFVRPANEEAAARMAVGFRAQ